MNAISHFRDNINNLWLKTFSLSFLHFYTSFSIVFPLIFRQSVHENIFSLMFTTFFLTDV